MEGGMNAQAVHSWTLCGLIGAFFELATAYFLLCGSAYAFLASKFLNIFGIFVPCPCSGIFGYQNSNMCLHKLLIDFPIGKIYSVQMLAKSRFPFSLICCMDQSFNSNVTSVPDGSCGSGVPELANEACYSSFSSPRLQNFVDRESEYDAKGKKIMNQKLRSGLWRRRRAASGYGKSCSYLSSGNMQPFVAGLSSSAYNGIDVRSGICESFGPISGTEDGFKDDGEPPNRFHVGEKSYHLELSGLTGDRKSIREVAEDVLAVENNISKAKNKPDVVENEENVIRALEQALEEEKAAYASLYLELEKERAAAATAADEAMAMILRLQEDKASIEMEARQYQRLIDEKFAHDEEEMNILKEIILMRERENHFLEKEVEAYRQMNVLGNEQSKEGGLSSMITDAGQGPSLSHGSVNGKTTNKKAAVNGANCDTLFADKELVNSVDDSVPEMEPTVHDVHVVEDETKPHDEGSRKIIGQSNWLPHVYVNNVSEAEPDIYRSLDSRSKVPVSGSSQHQNLPFDLRRNSSSVVNSERLRIDTEVEWLRIVKEEKEKVTFSAESRERVNDQLKLVEELVSQLREIQQLREPARQASLPPSSSKVSLSKRRCRSVPWDARESA